MELWPYLLISCVFLIILGYFTWFYRNSSKRATALYYEIRHKVVTELELSLATKEQLVEELKCRPIRFILMFPEFEVDDVLKTIELKKVSLESVNVPIEVAIDVLKLSARTIEKEHAHDPWNAE